MKSDEFSIRARIKSFRYAFAGIRAFFRREHNAWLHLIATVAILSLAWWFRVNKTELLALVFAIGFVWVAEMFNTCIERMMDHLAPQQHADTKFIKDLAAGAVLTAAITAVIVGGLVFIPKFF